MNRRHILLMSCALAFGAVVAHADTSSYTGTLQSPDNATGTFDSTDSFTTTINLATTSNVTLQTYGFGGGLNAAGQTISPGGTDPFVGLFSGIGDGALFINGTALDLANYTAGCPPANTVSNFGDTTCGDVTLTFDDLAAGEYTVLLSDGNYVPCAANSVGCLGTLGEGVNLDATGGAFCNLSDGTGTPCPNTSGAFALDVTVNSVAPTPEPDSLALLGTGLLAVGGLLRRRRR